MKADPDPPAAPMLYYFLLLTALLMIGLELFTSLRNQKTWYDGRADPVWQWMYRWRWGVGVPFAALSPFLGYTIGEYRVVGFPLAVAAIDQEGMNYVGQLSFPFVVANAAIWYCVPHILLYLWSLAARFGR